jgi:hypothetical protein
MLPLSLRCLYVLFFISLRPGKASGFMKRNLIVPYIVHMTVTHHLLEPAMMIVEDLSTRTILAV